MSAQLYLARYWQIYFLKRRFSEGLTTLCA